jgi:sulfite exporter TauE/SafE
MEPLSLTLGAAAVMGLSFGAGPCNITCLPYLGPVFLTEQRRWQIVGLFSAGRLTGYALLGAIAGLFGQSLEAFLDASWGTWLLGLATVLMGVALWRKGGAPSCKSSAQHSAQRVEFIDAPTTRATGNGGLLFMGLGLALNPCTPLSALLLAAAASHSVVLGSGLGLAFGLGAVLVPALLFGLLVAHFGNEVRAHLGRWQPRLTRAAAVMLIMLGFATVMGWVVA